GIYQRIPPLIFHVESVEKNITGKGNKKSLNRNSCLCLARKIGCCLLNDNILAPRASYKKNKCSYKYQQGQKDPTNDLS
ncbi:MAG TPA: hypothetical protein VK957_12940, partial [Lunatimonas sp.]|nr:hypothetical protein [Lunatimonas sp.]